MNDYLFKSVMEQLPAEGIQALLNPAPHLCIAIKSIDQGYLYANQNFIKLMGLSNPKDIMHLKDKDLCSNAALLDLYREQDETVYCEDKPLYIQGNVSPTRVPKLMKSMEGAIYPVHTQANKVDAVLLMTKPSNQMLNLSLELLLQMSADNLAAHLTKNSYPVHYKDLKLTLARMEILCFAELLKGKSATKTAQTIGLKSHTVESYLNNLRNKCRVGTKAELVQFFIDTDILKSIFI